MSADLPQKIVEFPKAEVPPEERARRLRVAVDRLAGLPTCEWLLYLDDDAEKHGVPRADLRKMVEATVKANEKKAREDRAEGRQQKRDAERRVEKDEARAHREAERARKEQERIGKAAANKQKEKDRAFAAIIRLPKSEREAKLGELAKKFRPPDIT